MPYYKSRHTFSGDALAAKAGAIGTTNARSIRTKARATMPLQDHHKLISVDDHLVEPPDLWVNRLPARYRADGPQIIEGDRHSGVAVNPVGEQVQLQPGQQAWAYEGRLYQYIGLNAVAGKDPSEFGFDPIRYDDMLPGCYDPTARLADMDRDGVHAAAAFPSFPRFAGTVFGEGTDKQLALLCVQAYNDFVLQDWMGTDPSRLLSLMILPYWDVEASVLEVERTAAAGANGFTFPENPVPLGLPSFHTNHWERLFSAVEAADLPLCMHFGTSGQIPTTAPDAPEAVFITLMGTNSMATLADMLFSPVFHNHPNLKVALAEGGIGWMPWLLQRADDTWERHRAYQHFNKEVRPSELFRKHIWGCFITDEVGIALRHEIGIDRITWECDYPHSDSNWPNSRKRVQTMFAEVADAEVAAIVEDNARKLFKVPA